MQWKLLIKAITQVIVGTIAAGLLAYGFGVLLGFLANTIGMLTVPVILFIIALIVGIWIRYDELKVERNG